MIDLYTTMHGENSISLLLCGMHPAGSVKGFMASYILDKALREGKLDSGGTVVEVSAGNTGIALAYEGKQRNLQTHLMLPSDAASSTVERILQYGGTVSTFSKSQGIEYAFAWAKNKQDEGCFWPNQFTNPEVKNSYVALAQYILQHHTQVDFFVSAIGTGGTIMGIGQQLKQYNPKIRIVGVEPENGTCMEGMRNTDCVFLEGQDLFDLSFPNSMLRISGPRAKTGLMTLDDISAGISTGAAYFAAVQISSLVENKTFVVISADGKKV